MERIPNNYESGENSSESPINEFMEKLLDKSIPDQDIANDFWTMYNTDKDKAMKALEDLKDTAEFSGEREELVDLIAQGIEERNKSKFI